MNKAVIIKTKEEKEGMLQYLENRYADGYKFKSTNIPSQVLLTDNFWVYSTDMSENYEWGTLRCKKADVTLTYSQFQKYCVSDDSISEHYCNDEKYLLLI